VLVARAARLLEEGVAPERVLALTFSRRSADELRERLRRECGDAALRIDVRTFHGFASRVLGAGGARFKTRRLLDALSYEALFAAAVRETPFTTLDSRATGSRAFRSEMGALLDDFDRVPAAALAQAQVGASPRLADLLALYRAFARLRERCGASDVNDLIGRAVTALDDEASTSARWLRDRYAHVLVDEFQDADRVQLALIAHAKAIVFAVGDEAQAIYRFRGSTPDIVAFGIAQFGLRVFRLSESRRCPPAVCALAARTPVIGAHAPRSAKDDGAEAVILRVRSARDEASFIAERIERLLEAGAPASGIAVLVRTSRPARPLLLEELRARAIPVAEAADGLVGDARVTVLRNALAVLASGGDRAAWRRFLAAPLFGLDPFAVRFADDPRSLAPAIVAAVDDVRNVWDTGDVGRTARLLARRLELLAAVMRDELPQGIRAAAGRLRMMCDALAAAQRTLTMVGADASAAAVLALYDEHVATLGGGGAEAAADGVRVLTIHGAKGLEFPHVFLADAVDGRFPQAERRSTLLADADRELLAACGIDGATIGDAQATEEASLWYVAVTRCSQALTISYAAEALDGTVQRPSRFIPPEMLPAHAHEVERVPLMIRAVRTGDAALRTRVAEQVDAARTPMLAAFVADGAAAFAPLPARALPVPERLSVSDAVLWFQCGRRLYYQRFLGIAGEDSTSSELGNALHRVLQRFHERETTFVAGEDGDVARWTSSLCELRRAEWAASTFEEGAAVAASAGAFADRVLGAYAARLGERARTAPFTVEACERSIEVPLGPVTLRGRVDRIDREADGRRVLIDYKSGKAKTRPFAKALAAELKAVGDDGSLASECTDDFLAQLAIYAGALDDVRSFAYVNLKGAKDDLRRVAVDETVLDDATAPLVARMRDDLRAHFAEPLAVGTLVALSPTRAEKNCTFCSFARVCPGAVLA
jgi:superfamily I DNA/RNA helicase